MNFKSLPQLLDFFKDENTCKEYYANIRWNGKPICPHCGHDKVYKTDRGYKCANKECYKKFSVTVGTIFENSKISLRYWFAAIYLCGTSKKGISSLQLSRQLNITQKTAWFLLHRIREMLKDKNPALLKNDVEVDESYIGGKEKNKHASKKRKNDFSTVGEKRKANTGRAITDKAVVLGLVERNGRVIAKRIPDAKAESIIPVIEKHVEKGATMLTDEWYAYNRLSGYTHKSIPHNLKIYVQGETHTNTIENFWATLKRGLYGIYHFTSKKHLDRYLDEFCARYNSRNISDEERFNQFLGQSNSRLTYKSLISSL